MPTYVYRCDLHGVTVEVSKPMARSGDPEYCPRCEAWMHDDDDAEAYAPGAAPMRRVYTVPMRAIIRPSGYRLSPDDPKFGDFRRELELGELVDDPTPVRLSAEELARADAMDFEVPADPERDYQLAQLVHQHWTNDLSDDTVRKRELAAQAAREGRL